MTFYDLAEDREYALELDQNVRSDYPDFADEGRAFVTKVLRKCDKQKALIFNGEAYDRENELGEMSTAHWIVCDALHSRSKGVTVPDWYLENIVRSSLGFGFAVINGGKT